MLAAGCWGLGSSVYGYRSYQDSYSVIQALIENGIKFFDTSDSYGDGNSEKVLGDFFEKYKHREKLFITTKVGLLPHNGFYMPTNFKIPYVKSKLEQSIRSLNCDYLDLYQLHSPSIDDKDEILEVFDWLKEKKKLGDIRNIGISVRSPNDAIEFLKFLNPDFIQANFNLIDQRFLHSGLYQICKERKISFLARTPLAFGFLTGTLSSSKDQFDKTDHRKKWPQEQLDVWASAPSKFSQLQEKLGISMLTLAHKYIQHYSDVVYATITGMYSISDVSSNLKSYYSELKLQESDIESILKIYSDNTFFVPGIKEKGPQ